MNKLFIIGLPRTGTTSVSVALLEYFKVAHTGYTKRTFELAEVISDCPCFSDYRQLDLLFPGSKFVYLQRKEESWVPSITMLLNKIIPTFNNHSYVSPILKRSFEQIFKIKDSIEPLSAVHLVSRYKYHENAVRSYFTGRDNILYIDISHQASMSRLLEFLGLPSSGEETFPSLNIGKRVDHWKEIKHKNKVNSNISGREGRKYFDY